jgi:hypothetical protein
MQSAEIGSLGSDWPSDDFGQALKGVNPAQGRKCGTNPSFLFRAVLTQKVFALAA